jgi:hypothetical protein
MRLRHAWAPAVAAVALLVGCDSKPADTVPKTAPMAAKEPFELLPHLKYIGVRKDLADLPVIAPQDLNGLYSNVWWFHNHAGQMDLNLTADEIKGLGVEKAQQLGYIAPNVSMSGLQSAMDNLTAGKIQAIPDEMQGYDVAKLDKLPGEKDKVNAKDYPVLSGELIRPLFNAGLFRLIKGVPAELWGDVAVQKTIPTKNNLETQVILQYQGTAIMELTARQKADKTYGIIYIHYLVQPKTLAKAAAQLKAK